jgi:hypothetical protein
MGLIGDRVRWFGIDKSTKPQTICQIIKKYYQTRVGGYMEYRGYRDIYGFGVSSVYRLILRPSQIMRQGWQGAQNGGVYKEIPNIPIGRYTGIWRIYGLMV